MKKKNRKNRFERINALLDCLSGKPNDSFDRKKPADYLKGREKVYLTKFNKQLFKSLTLSDFNYLLSLNFTCRRQILQVLLPQSVVGRAMTGRGWFTDKDGLPIKFSDVTFDKVLSAIEDQFSELNNMFARSYRSDLINNAFDHIKDNFDSDTLLLEIECEELLGVNFFKNNTVNTKTFLKGMVIAGFMDDYQMRQNTVKKYGKDFMGNIFDIGGGEQFIVKRKEFELLGINDPGKIEFTEDDIEKLEDSGTVFSSCTEKFSYPEYEKMFFRFKDDYGISDDLALISIGAIYGYDAMLGAFFMDAIDTYEKYLIEFSACGEDKNFAKIIQNYFIKKNGFPLISNEEIEKIIYISAKNNSPITYLSSSHRRFIQVEKGSTVPTFLNHWNFVSGDSPLYDVLLGYSKLPAKKFYTIAYQRLKNAGIEIKQPIFY